jgi:putative spermidine/putrescine transport system permease protein
VTLSRLARWSLRLWCWATLAFFYVPLAVVVILSFNEATSLSWPPKGFTRDWWSKAWEADAPKDAFWTSVRIAIAATAIALVLGSLAAFALHRFRFFGRSSISFLLVLPIALPGIVTGVALQNTFSRQFDIGPLEFKLGFGYYSVVIAHATFCVVVAFNNVIARLRRMSPNLLEASADLGASGSQTFRHVTFPLIRSALLAGGLLAFALSFDEIVVTTFTAGAGIETLPQWILNNFSRPNNVPIVNVVATVVMVLSIPLAWLAQRLSDSAGTMGAAAP